jgi:hypothetical protein
MEFDGGVVGREEKILPVAVKELLTHSLTHLNKE